MSSALSDLFSVSGRCRRLYILESLACWSHDAYDRPVSDEEAWEHHAY